ncbi:MAG TPA: hypothetical protein VF770_07150 [Solirubrobacterales bacterium]
MEQTRPTESEDPLRRLEASVERAAQAAERLFAEAASSIASQAASSIASEAAERLKPPPSGWQFRGQDPPPSAGGEFEALLGLLDPVREFIPPDLRRRLAEALRELLLAVRALIDWYVERLDHAPAEPVDVEDIPIL